MFHYFKRETVERSDKVVEEEGKKLQKEKESGNLSKDNQDISSDSMLAIDAAMALTSDPESSGSEQSSEEEFTLLPMPPEFVSGHLEYLEDALMCPDLPIASQTCASDYNNSDNGEDDHSDESNKNHDSSSDQSDNHCHDDGGNDVNNNDNVILQKQEMDTGGLHLHMLQSKVEDNYTKVVEGSGKPVEGKEEQEEEHKEYKAGTQWQHQEGSPSGSTLGDGVPISTSRDPEISATNEQSCNEELFEVDDNLFLIPSPALVEKLAPEPCPRCCPWFCFPCFPSFHFPCLPWFRRAWKYLVVIFSTRKKA
ncbi:uncharacterized protein LOC127557628 [Antechinus flavipes]|uniref:uncharacterized protein LOC127557628 n=1 Tax=Antechinus flavipes TaxID=38775 RepID=UPI002235F189|nr:uncharacterized protein LOC127557628 [Antechinus flavipes]